MKNVLLVEDFSDLADLISQVLEEEGYSVTATSKGDEAIAFCEDHRPDLIISAEEEQQAKESPSAMRQIRSRADFRHIPFVLMTSTGEVTAAEKARQLHATAYINKPFDLDAFLQTIRQILPGQ